LIKLIYLVGRCAATIFLILGIGRFTYAATNDDPVDDRDPEVSTPAVTPDIRDDEIPLKIQSGDKLIVPLLFSNPTLDTGIVAVGAYFYPQTEEQKEEQPASVTGGGVIYSSNDSKALAVGHQSYWGGDRWRLGGAVGYADLKLSVLLPLTLGSRDRVDWNVAGNIAFAKLSRNVMGNWFIGVSGRWSDIEQSFGLGIPPDGVGLNPVRYDLSADTVTAGLGIAIENDSRDMPMNSYQGHKFELSALFNDEALGSDNTYQSYKMAYSSYHELGPSVVLAWEVQGCVRRGLVPIWDGCRIPLRGFSAFDYIGKESLAGQMELRWRLGTRWGVAGFAGAGYIDESTLGLNDNKTIPSYGIGVRFMALKAKRINLRLDIAKSEDSEAIHFSIGEAF